jgi:hypothetical protein
MMVELLWLIARIISYLMCILAGFMIGKEWQKGVIKGDTDG